MFLRVAAIFRYPPCQCYTAATNKERHYTRRLRQVGSTNQWKLTLSCPRCNAELSVSFEQIELSFIGDQNEREMSRIELLADSDD